jgi:hypothetical protein
MKALDLESPHMASQPTDIEKNNLESHVELCALRYGQLETRLANIENKVAGLLDKFDDSRSSLAKVILGSTATVVAGLLSTVLTILIKF